MTYSYLQSSGQSTVRGEVLHAARAHA